MRANAIQCKNDVNPGGVGSSVQNPNVRRFRLEKKKQNTVSLKVCSAGTHLDNVVVGKLVPSLLQCLRWGRRELSKGTRTEDPDGAPRVEGGLELCLGAALGLLVRPALVLEQQLPLGPPLRLGYGPSFPVACCRVDVRSLFSICFVVEKASAFACVCVCVRVCVSYSMFVKVRKEGRRRVLLFE